MKKAKKAKIKRKLTPTKQRDQGPAHRQDNAARQEKPPAGWPLRFTPYAWAKLVWLRDQGDTEIGGFGISAPDDLLLVEDIVTIPQKTTAVTVAFDDEAVADFFEDQVDQGRRPEQFARLWIHTHPGNCPSPSGTDEETFHRVFGRSDWALMFILAMGGECYARLRFNTGPGAEIEVPVGIDYNQPFPASDHEAWEAEYDTHVQPQAMQAWNWRDDQTSEPDPYLQPWLDPFGMDDEDLEMLDLDDDRLAQLTLDERILELMPAPEEEMEEPCDFET